MNKDYHIPVMLDETLDLLNINPNGIYIDATFGGGGHSFEILKRLDTGKLIAFDMDKDALKNDLNKHNFLLIHSNFRYIPYFLTFLGIEKIDGIIADLGVSSFQIDEPNKGFTFRHNVHLDMRMNAESEITAEYILNKYTAEELVGIFSEYGEIFNAKKLTNLILQERKKKKITTTFQLIEAIKKAIPTKNKNKYLAKIFQALRIEVNKEIENLKIFLNNLREILKPGGIVVVISYHSLEDRLVKKFFKTGNLEGQRHTDIYGNLITDFIPLTKKPVMPSEEELKLNPRARSAKLRAAYRTYEKNEK